MRPPFGNDFSGARRGRPEFDGVHRASGFQCSAFLNFNTVPL